VETLDRQFGGVNRQSVRPTHSKTTCNLFEPLRVISNLQHRISVVGNIDVGNKTPTRKTGQPTVERSYGNNGLPELRIDQPNPSRPEYPGNCGAMTLQSGDSGWGNQSAPQKLLHLVGCREAKPLPDLPKRHGTAKR
jgi:hypothetical protein